MNIAKDENIRETIVEFEGKLFLRREGETATWKVCAGTNGSERWWVSLCKQEEKELEKRFNLFAL